jgi:C-terminal processing protease CtpA/Prc
VTLCLSLICILSCGVSKNRSFNPDKKFAPVHLQQDFETLRIILEANHPSLYWYATKDSIDNYFADSFASLQDSLNELQFKNKVSWVISKIHCGHTTVRFSKDYTNFFSRKRLPSFPLSLKVWKDSAVVVANLFAADSVIRRGTIVTAINRKPITYYIDSMLQLIGTDGYSDNFKYQFISFNFPGFYRNTFGIDSQYIIKYLDSTGTEREKFIKNFYPRADTAKRVDSVNKVDPGTIQEVLTRRQLKKQLLLGKRSLRIDTTNNSAYLLINTFSEAKLFEFFRKSFRKIRQDSIHNLIIDLRLNSGGDVFASTRLSEYVIDHPFRVADTVAAISRSFKGKKYIRPWFIYWLSMHFSGKRKEDGRIHFRYFEKHLFKPKKKNHFNGNIYLLTGGYTFSAATLFAGDLKGQKNVTIVGEETGGGFYGNTAMFLTTIVLPNTKIRVTLPLYRMVLDAKRPKNGRGIFPDVEVLPNSYYIKKGVDAKLEKVMELISQQKSNH